MKEQLIVSGSTVLVAIVAAIIVMIVHDFTKAVAYMCYINIYNKKYNKLIICPGIFKIHRYIDPVGLILAVTNYTAFSKPYPYIIKSKKAALIIGILGYVSLGMLFALAIIGHNYILPTVILHEYVNFILHGVLEFVAYFCVMMFLANLMPIVSFDMSLIISAVAPVNYVKLYKFDLFYKLTFIVLSLLGVFTVAGVYITTQFLID